MTPYMKDMIDIVSKMFEADMNDRGIKNVFNSAQDISKGRFFKKEVSANELLRLWGESRYPTDARDIVNILRTAKFSDKEINKAFKNAGFGSASSPNISPAMEKLAKVIISRGYKADIIKFLSDNFPEVMEVYVDPGNMVVEDIRALFTEVSKVERESIDSMIDDDIATRLGRAKKQ